MRCIDRSLCSVPDAASTVNALARRSAATVSPAVSDIRPTFDNARRKIVASHRAAFGALAARLSPMAAVPRAESAVAQVGCLNVRRAFLSTAALV